MVFNEFNDEYIVHLIFKQVRFYNIQKKGSMQKVFPYNS